MTTPDSLDLPGDWDDSPQPRRRRGRKVALIILIVLAVIIAGIGLVTANYLRGLQSDYEKRTTVTLERGASDGERPAEGEGTNYLLLGSDKRSEDEAEASGVTGQRSDVVMLVHVSADNSAVHVMSFPRDLYIDIPGHGKGRINSALAYGGVPLAVTTVENYTQVPIDHVALIDFDGIEGLVDSLGGVNVQVQESFEAGDFQFTQGTQRVTGEEALVFVRARKQFSDGDFQRNRNQQALLLGILDAFISRDTLSSPTKVADAVESISPYLTTDEGLTSTAMVQLGLSLRDIRTSDIQFLAVPVGPPVTTSGGAAVISTDEAAMDELRTALKEDDMATYYSENVEN